MEEGGGVLITSLTLESTRILKRPEKTGGGLIFFITEFSGDFKFLS